MSIEQLVEQTRQIWAEALSQEVADDTDFFEAGGHSFAAIKIISLLGERLDVQVPLRSLFDYPQFDEFVAAVAASQR